MSVAGSKTGKVCTHLLQKQLGMEVSAAHLQKQGKATCVECVLWKKRQFKRDDGYTPR